MHPAPGLKSFLRAPVGNYLVSPTFLRWCHDLELTGVAFWGRLDASDVEQMIASLDVTPAVLQDHRYDLLVDSRRFEGVDPAGFNLMSNYIRANCRQLCGRYRRHAIVRPSGMSGAVAAGFYEVLGRAPFPVGVFTDVASAYQWLGRSNGAVLAAELENILQQECPQPSLVRKLRALLADRPTLDIRGAASELAVSARSLQRQLHAAATTFAKEVDRARLQIARQLLQDTDEKIESIAARIGFSRSHFTVMFGRATGQSPSRYRLRAVAARLSEEAMNCARTAGRAHPRKADRYPVR